MCFCFIAGNTRHLTALVDADTIQGCAGNEVDTDHGTSFVEPEENDCVWDVDDSNAPVLKIPPVGGRLVIFLSGAVDHEVLPSHANRFALTAWCQ